MEFNPLAFMELFIVLGIGLAWAAIELVCLRYDKKRQQEKERTERESKAG